MRSLRYSPVVASVLAIAGVASADCPQLLLNNEFSTGMLSPWVIETPYDYATVYDSISDDSNHALILDVLADDPEFALLSDAGLSQGISLVGGGTYRLSFWATASSSVDARIKVGDAEAPYAYYGLDENFVIVDNGDGGANYEFTFTAPKTDDTAGLIIMFGGLSATIKFDSFFLTQTNAVSCSTGTGGTTGSGGTDSGGTDSGGTGSGGASTMGGSGSGGTTALGGSVATGGSVAATGGVSATGGTSGVSVTGAIVRVNQLGYVPSAEKVATVKHSSMIPLDFQLLDGSSNVLMSGVTRAMASDAISGDYVHLADFSTYKTAGTGLRLKVGNAVSPTFRIGGDVFGRLRRDALRFYYHQRASSSIGQPYAEGEQWVRGAGHSDRSVPCRSGTGCSYSLNVSKGWYDAGDYGKYVVNGGISAWTLMHLYERAQHLGAGIAPLGDGTLNIPESSNGASDLLDQVRWEMEFLLGMQVPAGQTLAGMVHHKVHGTKWPPMPSAPEDDVTGRVLSAPSTAATLNLAATAAQCARVFASSDATFSAKCRAAATAAYTAAVAHPAVYAVNTPNGGGDDDGGGAYDDANVTDEFYWAASELFITTGETQYLNALLASTHHKKVVTGAGPLNWSSTAVAGALSLAVVPSHLSSNVLADVRSAIVSTANGYFAIAANGYGSPIQEYFWGSNSDVLNSAIVLGVSYDLTGDVTYRGAALSALDYVLGRNPLGQSYVTSYGTLAFENVHHRFFANAFDSSWPLPPPGFMAGGANKSLDGLTVQGALAGCKGPKCWTDVATAYGLTEVAVNWNAPLAWVAAWASEQEQNPKTSFPGVGVVSGTGGATSVGGASSTASGGSATSVGGTSSTAIGGGAGGTASTTLSETTHQGGATVTHHTLRLIRQEPRVTTWVLVTQATAAQAVQRRGNRVATLPSRRSRPTAAVAV